MAPIQLKLNPLDNTTLQQNYTTILTEIKECCDIILIKKTDFKSKNKHNPYMGNREIGQLSKLKSIIIKNRRKVISVLQNHSSFFEIDHIDTSFLVFIINGENIMDEITQTTWNPQAATDPIL